MSAIVWYFEHSLALPFCGIGMKTDLFQSCGHCCESESAVAQSCPTLCDPMDCSLPGSSFHGILQARVLEWVVISFSRGSSRPRDRTQVSRIPGRCFNLSATREGRFTQFSEDKESINPVHTHIPARHNLFTAWSIYGHPNTTAWEKTLAEKKQRNNQKAYRLERK